MRHLLTILLLATFGIPALAEPTATERYYSGLRQRGMLDLAEGEALRQLSLPNVAANERALLVAELARTFVEHAKYAEGREQEDLWKRADAILDDALHIGDKSTDPIELEVLQGELQFTRGETLRWLAELMPEQSEHAQKARSSLNSAVTLLTPLEQQLEKRLRDRIRGRTERTERVTALRLDELLTRVRLALGKSELEFARLSETNAAHHVTAAEQWFEPVAKGARSEEDTWQAQIGLAEAARLVGEADTVRRRLAALDPRVLPDQAKDEIATVSTKLMLDEHKPDRAVAFLIDYRRTRGSLTGELRLLQIAGLDAAAAALVTAGNDAEAVELRDQIATVVRWTEAEHGGFWAYRARLAARRADRYSRYATVVASHVHEAEAAVHAGEFDHAAKAYGEAAQLSQSDLELSLGLGSLQASMLLQAGRYQEAANAFLSITNRETRPEKAAEAHLLSAYALGRFHDAEPSTERRIAYVGRLEEHRTQFPATETAAEATMRLARLLEQRRQYSQALPLFREVIGNAERGPAAAAGIARSYDNLLRYLDSMRSSAATADEAAIRSEQLSRWSEQAVQELDSLTTSLRSDSAAGSPLTALEAELALRTSELVLTHRESTAVADALLDRLRFTLDAVHPVEEQAFWNAVQRSSRPLSIISLATRGHYAKAEQLVASLATAPVGDILAVVQQLLELTDPDATTPRRVVFGAAEGNVGPRLADLQRSATDILLERREELSASQAQQFDVIIAKANLAAGRSGAATEQFAKALADGPKDKSLLRQAATMLADSDDPDAVSQARDYWRRLETLEANGSSEWFEARLSVIETSLALGDVTEARKLLAVTRLLHPHLGGAATKAAFDAVQRRLGAETAGARKSQSR